MRRPAPRRLLLAALALLALDAAGVAWFAGLTAGWAERLPPTPPGGAAVILYTGAPDPTGLSPECRRRAAHGLHRLLSGQVGRLICAGGSMPRQSYVGARVMRGWLLSRGAPPERVAVEGRSCDSLSNLAYSDCLARHLGERRLRVISAPAHLMRLRHLLGRERPRLAARLAWDPHPAAPWWRALVRPGWWLAAHHEWASYALYVLLPEGSYRSLVHWLRGCDPCWRDCCS